MTRRTTLLRVGIFALICFAGLAALNYSGAEPPLVQKVQEVQIQPLPAQVPPNFQPFQAGDQPIQVNPGFGGGKFNGPIPNATEPVAVETREGKKGWKVTIPGNRPLATPAVVDGKVYVGGGFGSYEFYCLDAKSGKQQWVYRTGDDGPTAAVVAEGYVAFNTESCEIEIITMDGKQVWKKWLGDPLMSMPAISQGKVYMSYPGNDGKHHLACYELKTGQQIWDKHIPAQIVTAPIISKGNLYVTSMDGTMSCMDKRDGAVVWTEKKNATSAPVVYNGKVYFSRRDVVKVQDKDGKMIDQQQESLADRIITKEGQAKDLPGTAQPADYLDIAKREKLSTFQGAAKSLDAGVGFGAAPAAAGLGLGSGNIGQNTVQGVWSYQGSKPFVSNGLLYSAMGDQVKCVDPESNKVLWTKEFKGNNQGPLVDSALTPPAIVNGKMFMGTTSGKILCMSAKSGELLWSVTISEPITFQPSVMNGYVYVSTTTGTLYAIETGDAKDSGWAQWGGNAEHNGLEN